MAGPTNEGKNIIQFTAADQETTTAFRVTALSWYAHASSTITANDDMLLEDGAGVPIASKRAIANGDGLRLAFPGEGLVVNGLKAEDLDGGYLFVYGERM